MRDGKFISWRTSEWVGPLWKGLGGFVSSRYYFVQLSEARAGETGGVGGVVCGAVGAMQ